MSGYIELEVDVSRHPANLGLIAPCGLIEQVTGDKIKIYTASTSLYADLDGRTEEIRSWDGYRW